MYLVCMVVGLVGLVLMAIPGLGRHGHAAHTGGHAGHIGGHAGHAGGGHAHGAARGGKGGSVSDSLIRPTLSVRMIFSLLAMFGAVGYALSDSTRLAATAIVAASLASALALELMVMTPLWNFFMRFQGKPATPLAELMLEEAEAVTPFRNGRGVVSVIHDGVRVQMVAELEKEHAAFPVRVGDRLRIEEIDPARERARVSIK